MKTIFKWQGNKSKHFKYILSELHSPTFYKKKISIYRENESTYHSR